MRFDRFSTFLRYCEVGLKRSAYIDPNRNEPMTSPFCTKLICNLSTGRIGKARIVQSRTKLVTDIPHRKATKSMHFP